MEDKDQIHRQKGFTFVEILVVLLIASTILVLSIGSYFSLQRRSRDTNRKSDVEQIRAALEMYRSNNNDYPVSLTFGTGSISDGSNTYLQTIPNDPRSFERTYYYAQAGTDYILAVHLEGDSTCTSAPGGNSCGTGYGCNYCFNSYGKQ